MDWVASICTMVSVELIARKKWYGWLVGILNQAVWVGLMYHKNAWGLLPLAFYLVIRYTLALLKWRDDDEREKRAAGTRGV